MNRNVMESGFIWLLVCVLFSFYNGFITGGAILYLSTSGLIVIASLVETSFGFAYRDQLTGLMSRRSMDDYILTLGGNYTIALIDIDFFKKFNDRYGHDVGDQVLRMISLKLKKVGGRGKVFRYGGEEFAVVFAGKKLDKAIRHMEELRENISKSKFIIRGIKRPKKKPTAVKSVVGSKANVRITVSLGVADNSGENTTPLQVIKSADLALYRAKKSGRNKVWY
ncbi:MAG: GGDEF domain-containing protein [Thermodesulfobacteriota bacterium]